jgi:hypothetical protein
MQALSRQACGLLLVLTLAGCSRDEPARSVTVPARSMAGLAASVGDASSLILPDLMDWMVDPAAAVLFAAADQQAWPDLEPRSEQAWQAVVDAADQLARSSDMLVQPALALGRGDWRQWTEAMREAAAAGAAAARRHDPTGLFEAAAQVRASCQICHAFYAAPIGEPLTLRPPR